MLNNHDAFKKDVDKTFKKCASAPRFRTTVTGPGSRLSSKPCGKSSTKAKRDMSETSATQIARGRVCIRPLISYMRLTAPAELL
jgi:hypothetical protein